MESLEQRRKGNTGRHVMAIDGRLIDGYEGWSGAQYGNTAYRAPSGWRNKARMRDGGTIAVRKGCTVLKGEEILFAYHAEYWARWAPMLEEEAHSDEESYANDVEMAATTVLRHRE